MSSPPALPPDLYALAPTDLARPRADDRFDGAGFNLPLDLFSAADQAGLREVYAGVNSAALRWRDVAERPDWAALREFVVGVDRDRLIDTARGLGRGGAEDPRAAKLLHDVRGGGLVAFAGMAELIEQGAGRDELVRFALAAARDHAKIMRSALPELDPPAYAADEAARVHGIGGFVAAWDGRVVRAAGRAVSVRVRCSYAGPITARCLETAALDRVAYNLTNNAVRFAHDGRVTVWVFPVAAGLTRWVVENAVLADDAGWLARETGGDFRELFAGGRTRGGTGIGLANCAEITAAAFGLDDPAAAVAGGYLGAAVGGDKFRAWFHWPVPAAGGPGCPCDH